MAPIENLHRILDTTVRFFADRPDFGRLLHHIRGSVAITGPVLGEFNTDANPGFDQAMALLAEIVTDGQKAGEIRGGNARAIAHLYSVLVNEFILLGNPVGVGSLTSAQFHDLVDGALRAPESRTVRSSV